MFPPQLGEEPNHYAAGKEQGDRVRQHRQRRGHKAEGQRSAIALADTEVDGKWVHGREQEYERPIARVLGLVDMERTDRQKQGGEERGPGPDQAPRHQIERRDCEHPKERRQEPHPKLIEGPQRPYEVVVEEINQGPGIVERRRKGIAQGEDLVAFESPGAEPPEAEQGSQDDDAGEEKGGG